MTCTIICSSPVGGILSGVSDLLLIIIIEWQSHQQKKFFLDVLCYEGCAAGCEGYGMDLDESERSHEQIYWGRDR